MPSHRVPGSAYFILLLTCLTLVTMSVSCSKNQRNDTLHGSLVTVDTAYDRFIDWNAAHEQDLAKAAPTRELAEKAVADYQAKRQPVLDGIHVVYKLLALAATQTDDPSFKRAVAAAADLVRAIHALMGDA